jgi:hypothetical protein
VLRVLFLGRVSTAALRWCGRRMPDRTRRVLAALSPFALAWLVGEVRWTGPGRNVVPACRFRAEGGPALCAEVCRRPTERFCAEAGFPVSLAPDPGSLRCDWTWRAP